MTSFVHRIVTKKRETLRVCTLILLCALAFGMLTAPEPTSAPPLSLEGLTVALDPGHGGYDGGARARDSGRWEKDLTLQIALSVLVYKAVTDHSRKFWFIAFGIHFAVDFLTVIITGIGAPVWIVEVLLLIAVVFVARYAYNLYKKEA